jgi:hypothetical protein
MKGALGLTLPNEAPTARISKWRIRVTGLPRCAGCLSDAVKNGYVTLGHLGRAHNTGLWNRAAAA